MPENSITINDEPVRGRAISALLSPKQRAENYTLSVVWWSYPLHLLNWMLLLAYLALVAVLTVSSGLMGVSIAELAVGSYALYVLASMAKAMTSDRRLSGLAKKNFYFSYGSACIFKAVWMSTVVQIAMEWFAGHHDRSLVPGVYGTFDLEVAGYLFDDLLFVSSLVFWVFLHAGFPANGAPK